MKPQIESHNQVEKWSKSYYSILALICWTIGLSNCWRFTVVISNEGGGAFFLPCTLVSVFIAIPLTYLELGIGQFSSSGPIAVWKMCLFWRGAGWASIFVLLSLSLYYSTICSYLLFYVVASIQNTLPWSECNPSWAKENCYTFETNRSVREACVNAHGSEYCNNLDWQNSAAHYWGERVLQRLSTGELGHLRWELLLGNVFTLVVIFFCLRNGIKSLQRLLLSFTVIPHLLQGILVFISLIHPGSLRGLQYFLKPDVKKLQEFRTWRLAVEQILCSVGLGFGGFTMLGSHSNFRNPVHVHAIVANTFDLFCSLLFGIVSFNALGTLSYALNLSLDDIIKWDDNMLFVRMPLALMHWPGTSQLWCFIFFSSIYIMGLRSQMFIVATLLSALYETWPVMLLHRTVTVGVTCVALFIFGLPYYTQVGSLLVNYVDNINATCMILMVVFLEVVGVIWWYGLSNFVDDMHFMLGFRSTSYWQCAWITCPFIMFIFFITSTYDWRAGTEGLPPWAWVMFYQWFMYCIPLVLVSGFIVISYVSRTNSLKFFLRPAASWGPVDPILHKSRDMFTAHSMTKEYMYRQNRVSSRRFQPEIPVVLQPIEDQTLL